MVTNLQQTNELFEYQLLFLLNANLQNSRSDGNTSTLFIPIQVLMLSVLLPQHVEYYYYSLK